MGQQSGRGFALSDPAGHEATQDAIDHVDVLHADDDTPPVADDHLQGLVQWHCLVVAVLRPAESGKEQVGVGQVAQLLQDCIDMPIRDEGGLDGRGACKFLPDLALDRLVGRRVVTDHNDVLRLAAHASQQRKVRGNLLLFENPGDRATGDTLQCPEVVDPGEEHRDLGKDLRQVIQGKRQRVVVGHIDGVRREACILEFQVRLECLGIPGFVGASFGVEMFRLDVGLAVKGGLERLRESQMLALRPGVVLVVRMQHENANGIRRRGGAGQ